MSEEEKKLLVIPSYFKRVNEATSIRLLQQVLWQMMAERYKLIIMVPHPDSRWCKWHWSEYWDQLPSKSTDRIEFVECMMPKWNIYPEDELRRKFAQRMDWACVLTTKIWAYFVLRRALLKFRPGPIEPRIVLYMIDKWEEIRPGEVFEVVGTAISKYAWPIMESNRMLDEYVKRLRPYIKPDKIVEFNKRNPVVDLGIPIEEIAKVEEKIGVFQGKRDPNGLLFLYGGNLKVDHIKRVKDTAALLEKMRLIGYPVQLRVHCIENGQEEMIEFLTKNYPHLVEIRANRPREEYITSCLEANFFLCMSRDESFGIAWFEKAYCGAVGLLVEEDWHKGIWPNEYPLRVKEEDRQYEKLVYVACKDGYGKFWPMVSWIREWIANKYDMNKNMRDMSKWMEPMVLE